jgi:hypothetical protein
MILNHIAQSRLTTGLAGPVRRRLKVEDLEALRLACPIVRPAGRRSRETSGSLNRKIRAMVLAGAPCKLFSGTDSKAATGSEIDRHDY